MELLSRTWRTLWCKVCLWPGDFQVNLIKSLIKVMILMIGATEWVQRKFRVRCLRTLGGHLEGVYSFRFVNDAAKRIDDLNL